MSNKAYTLIIIGAGLLLLIGGFFLGWNVKPAHTCPVVTDTVLVKGDTAWLPSELQLTYGWEDLPAETDTVDEEVIKSSSVDSTFTYDKDVVRIQAEVKYNLETDLFDWLLNIEHKDFGSHQTDTLKVYIMETVEIETSNPFWLMLSIAEFFLIILAIIF